MATPQEVEEQALRDRKIDAILKNTNDILTLVKGKKIKETEEPEK